MQQSGDGLSRKVQIGALFSFYGALLTDNQRELVEQYCNEDLSLTEIAEQFGISRQGVQDGVQKAYRKLKKYEDALGLYGRFRRMNEALNAIEQTLARMDAAGVQGIEALKQILQSLREEES